MGRGAYRGSVGGRTGRTGRAFVELPVTSLVVPASVNRGSSMYEKDGKLEYPPDHVGKRTYVTVKGYSYSVPVIYCYMAQGRYYLLDGEGPEASSGPTIMRDLEPYRSPLDGSMVTSRSEHRNHMRQHGVIERGNEPVRARTQDIAPPRPIHDIRRAMGID